MKFRVSIAVDPNQSSSVVFSFRSGASKMPSTAFCLLLRLFTLRGSEKQMKLMLDHVDSPHIRCIGFLYLRYACEPRMLWRWIEPYLYDEEPVRVEANQSRPETTVGEYVCSLLTDMNYHGTLLPRLPVNIEREIKVKLLQEKQNEDRAKCNARDARTMQYFQTLGSRVRALYGDDENPMTWYDAVVDRVVNKDESGASLLRPKFVVTFPEYGNTETVTLGEMDMPEGAAGAGAGSHRGWPEGRGDAASGHERRGSGYDRYDDRRGHRGGDLEGGRSYAKRDEGGRYERDRPRDKWDRDRYRGRERSRERDSKPIASEKDLMEEVIHQDRERSLANGRSYASRPPTAEASLSSAGSGYKNTPSAQPPDDRGRGRPDDQLSSSEVDKKPDAVPKRKTAEEMAAVLEKKRRLMAKYG
jgi:pre-mRNA-splicing factor 38B